MREPSTTFLRVINKIAGTAKSPSDFGTGDLLYFSEIQIIDVAGNNPEINITELSNILGVTEGTASPAANILTWGYLKKIHASDDSRVVRLQLTEKGEVAWKGLAKQAKEYVSEYAREFTAVQWDTFNNIIARLEAFIDNRLKKGT